MNDIKLTPIQEQELKDYMKNIVNNINNSDSEEDAIKIMICEICILKAHLIMNGLDDYNREELSALIKNIK